MVSKNGLNLSLGLSRAVLFEIISELRIRTFESRVEGTLAATTSQNLCLDYQLGGARVQKATKLILENFFIFKIFSFIEASRIFSKKNTYYWAPSTPSWSVSATRNRWTASPCFSINSFELNSWRFNRRTVWRTGNWAILRNILEILSFFSFSGEVDEFI